ncbi:MAG: hypothetical protein IT326_07285, partial [Anaerolineae bacterium]|nr:hypothetical protein [Anaerolineae bacterium]
MTTILQFPQETYQARLRTASADASGGWTWVHGAPHRGSAGVYNAINNAELAPGARYNAATCTDANGALWLFGGYGADHIGQKGWLSDLWRWDGKQWMWFHGANVTNSSGNYYTQSRFHPRNTPGARYGAALWFDRRGYLWLFGGYGYDAHGVFGLLNDLWCWRDHQWCWVSGASRIDTRGIYQEGGDRPPHPGARAEMACIPDG